MSAIQFKHKPRQHVIVILCYSGSMLIYVINCNARIHYNLGHGRNVSLDVRRHYQLGQCHYASLFVMRHYQLGQCNYTSLLRDIIN